MFPMELREALAGVIDDERKARQMSERSLSEAASIPLATLHRHLKGVSPFDTDELHRIARAFGCNVSDLTSRAEAAA